MKSRIASYVAKSLASLIVIGSMLQAPEILAGVCRGIVACQDGRKCVGPNSSKKVITGSDEDLNADDGEFKYTSGFNAEIQKWRASTQACDQFFGDDCQKNTGCDDDPES